MRPKPHPASCERRMVDGMGPGTRSQRSQQRLNNRWESEVYRRVTGFTEPPRDRVREAKDLIRRMRDAGKAGDTPEVNVLTAALMLLSRGETPKNR